MGVLLHQGEGVGNALAVEVGLDVAATAEAADELTDALLGETGGGAEALAAKGGVEEQALLVDAAAPETTVKRIVAERRKNGVEPRLDFREDAVLISRDISAGIVPIDPEQRAWREDVGRYLASLAAKADTVTRIFCGLPQKLK